MTTAVPEVETTGLARFYVLTASDDLTTFTLVGTQEARDRDHAIRLQFGKQPPVCVAVSAKSFRVRKPRTVAVVRGLTDVDIPLPFDDDDQQPINDRPDTLQQ